MKRSLILGVAAGILAINTVQASDVENELMPMAYLQIPFEALSKKEVKTIHGFGIARSEVDIETGSISFVNTKKVPFVDFRFSGKEIESIKFNGINALSKKLVHNADGTTETATAINWNIVIPVVVVGGVVAYAVTKDDDNKKVEDEAIPPPGGWGW